ncbi:Hypp6707 [Branchiostoma lanceolatum]|uniref:Hypp6707 protein n=1 Tax=Branchiostoma lanceolatum TaxID=7740 RepID=A0A8J9YVF9_BRALA|nr:Hypp6707 [Branchiostoma lanceolatum]
MAVKSKEGTSIQMRPCAYISSLKTAVYDNLSRSADAGSPDDTTYNIRVFAASDYALLSLWFGISGACETTILGSRQQREQYLQWRAVRAMQDQVFQAAVSAEPQAGPSHMS